jgi:hypothetical protein
MTNPRASIRRWWPLLIAALVGLFAGYEMSFAASEGGLGAIFRGGLVLLAIVAAVVVLGVPGFLLLAMRPKNPTGPLLVGFVGVLIGGVVVAHLAVPALGLGYHAPVELEATGQASLTLDDPRFTATDPAAIACRSIRDGQAVAWFRALDLGRLDGAIVRADVYLTEGGVFGLFVPDSDPPDPKGAPQWQGSATYAAGADGRSGTIDFADLQLQHTAGLPEPAPGWPEHLAGRLTWSCGDWLGPIGLANGGVRG